MTNDDIDQRLEALGQQLGENTLAIATLGRATMDTNLLDRILPQAQIQRLLQPTNIENVCLVSTINTANKLLYLIKERKELATSQVAHHSGLNANTCKCYLRKLVELGWIEKSRASADSVESLWVWICG